MLTYWIIKVIGGNPYTIAVLKDIIGDNSSPHNCYGLGQPQCVTDGYRKDKNDLVMYPEKTIFELNQMNKEKLKWGIF